MHNAVPAMPRAHPQAREPISSAARAALSAHLLQQGLWCAEGGSPFNAALLRACAANVEEGGILADLLSQFSVDPMAASAALRLTGAFHAAVLSGLAPDMAALYPAQRRKWSMDDLFPLALAFAEKHPAWMRGFMQSPPQTNEIQRAIAFLPGILAALRPGHARLHLLELGASAGLNLMLDRFAYRTRNWGFGRAAEQSPVLDCSWAGPAPNLRSGLPVASRAGCDQSPLDPRNPEDMLRLKAFVWADQPERIQRLERAAALAIAHDVRVARADAADWIEQKLSQPLPEGLTLVFHSIAWRYFSQSTRNRVEAAIRAAGARATQTAALAWLRFEHRATLGQQGEGCVVDLRAFPGGTYRVTAHADAHARTVEALI